MTMVWDIAEGIVLAVIGLCALYVVVVVVGGMLWAICVSTPTVVRNSVNGLRSHQGKLAMLIVAGMFAGIFALYVTSFWYGH
jgi:hypothetical protein